MLLVRHGTNCGAPLTVFVCDIIKDGMIFCLIQDTKYVKRTEYMSNCFGCNTIETVIIW